MSIVSNGGVGDFLTAGLRRWGITLVAGSGCDREDIRGVKRLPHRRKQGNAFHRAHEHDWLHDVLLCCHRYVRVIACQIHSARIVARTTSAAIKSRVGMVFGTITPRWESRGDRRPSRPYCGLSSAYSPHNYVAGM